MTEQLTVAALLAEGLEQLRAARGGAEVTPELDAQLLLGHVLGVPRVRLKSHPEALPDPGQTRQYRDLLTRRAAGEPVAYLIGSRDFWSLSLAVSPEVLIPRPETELLVERGLALWSAAEASVADLGTGSGAVALALAHERPRWRVVATDASPEALAVARANAARLSQGRVEFRLGDWYQPLAGERFDLLLSNPPYIAAGDAVLGGADLRYEPRRALTPGDDALACLRILARGAAQHLKAGGWVLLEHGATQAAEVRRELVLAGLRYVRSHRDLAGHERMTEGQHDQI